ncbi:MAG: GAF domain-containing protein [Verrucomicrobiia bacterium]|jgi:adenylate cyclase
MAAKKKSAALKKSPDPKKVRSPISDAIYGADGGPKDPSERLRLMELLVDVAQRVARLKSLDKILATLVGIITDETGADRSSLFLHDEATSELYSRIAQGNIGREIRILDTHGVAGWVYTNRRGDIIHDAYKDKRFDAAVDKELDYKTNSILAAPIKTVEGKTIGVVQALNKKKGRFSLRDLHLVEAMTTQAAITLVSQQYVEHVEKKQNQEMEFLNVVSDVTSELELTPLLERVMKEANRMLQADRSTLFMHDEKTNELWAQVGTGIDSKQIRFPNHLGIAGAVYKSGTTINIPYAYADLRFNPAFDKQTGYFTRSILCVPIVTRQGKVIGVTQCLNKQGGPFNTEDEQRLKAFTGQISIGLENAQNMSDMQEEEKRNSALLKSMSSAVISINEEGFIDKCNEAGLDILRVSASEVLKQKAVDFFNNGNKWIGDLIKQVEKTQEQVSNPEAKLTVNDDEIFVSFRADPLIGEERKKLGTLILMDDITNEVRRRHAMKRFMGKHIAEILSQGDPQDKATIATVLFSDIRGFTTLTEKLGPAGTVAMLNEYFDKMEQCVEAEGGAIDKIIGDALMCGFGHIHDYNDEADRGVRAAIAMINDLKKLNETRKERGEEPINIGIGLNTDEVIIGGIGSANYANYTMIGDGVNLAARLESACKAYHAKILISEFTYKSLKGTYRTRVVDKVVVKGKTEPVGVYEVLDHYDDESFPNVMEVLNYFNGGVELYRKKEWNRAIKAFKEARKNNPKDKLTDLYIDRCEHFKANPPPKDWQGEWVMTSK